MRSRQKKEKIHSLNSKRLKQDQYRGKSRDNRKMSRTPCTPCEFQSTFPSPSRPPSNNQASLPSHGACQKSIVELCSVVAFVCFTLCCAFFYLSQPVAASGHPPSACRYNDFPGDTGLPTPVALFPVARLQHRLGIRQNRLSNFQTPSGLCVFSSARFFLLQLRICGINYL